MARPLQLHTRIEAGPRSRPGREEIYARAVKARDRRFDGVFFVGIVSTMIYCRPICPARISHPEHRRFFESAAAAERAGYRPCRRCRPELAPGRALVNAVPRLARAAAHRIAGGSLNGRSVSDLARDLCVSERHLRRALKRELGVTPVQLAQTHRLLLAKRLLTDSTLPVTRIAFASGFQSVRRFNDAFRDHYRMTPADLRRGDGRRRRVQIKDGLRLTLTYRPPLAWRPLLDLIGRALIPGVEVLRGVRYSRTARIDGHAGVVTVKGSASRSGAKARGLEPQLIVEISDALVPVLLPLIARLRHLFDLDADPSSVDECLVRSGLASQVRRRPGIRIPGAFDGFEVALGLLLQDPAPGRTGGPNLARQVANALGDPITTGLPELTHLAPTPGQVADAGVEHLRRLDVPEHTAEAVVALAVAVAEGRVRLELGEDPDATRDALLTLPGLDDRLATMVIQRTLAWPDAFPATDRSLQHAAGTAGPDELLKRAEAWRPWRTYAAAHLWLDAAVSRLQRGRPA